MPRDDAHFSSSAQHVRPALWARTSTSNCTLLKGLLLTRTRIFRVLRGQMTLVSASPAADGKRRQIFSASYMLAGNLPQQDRDSVFLLSTHSVCCFRIDVERGH